MSDRSNRYAEAFYQLMKQGLYAAKGGSLRAPTKPRTSGNDPSTKTVASSDKGGCAMADESEPEPLTEVEVKQSS